MEKDPEKKIELIMCFMILESNKIEYVSLKANDVLAISKVFNSRDIKA